MKSETAPHYRHLDLAGTPTLKLVDELLHRLSVEPKDTYQICPNAFTDLRHTIANAREGE